MAKTPSPRRDTSLNLHGPWSAQKSELFSFRRTDIQSHSTYGAGFWRLCLDRLYTVRMHAVQLDGGADRGEAAAVLARGLRGGAGLWP
jgi:hypothetical protein